MYTVELTVRNTPLPLSVQKKELDAATAAYQMVLEAIRSGSKEVLELTCEQQMDKKVAVLASDLVAVQIYEKSGATASGRTPGFFSMA